MFVTFYGGVAGLAHVSECGLAPGQKPAAAFEAGQGERLGWLMCCYWPPSLLACAGLAQVCWKLLSANSSCSSQRCMQRLPPG